jgi:hypothetical protein
MISLLILAIVVGLLVWVCSLLPLPAPFQKVILVIGVIIVVFAVLSTLFGIDVFGYMRSLR